MERILFSFQTKNRQHYFDLIKLFFGHNHRPFPSLHERETLQAIISIVPDLNIYTGK
jgi:hypothetical protein